MWPFLANSALSKLFTVGQTCRGRRYSASPIRGAIAPSWIASGKCSSLGESGVSSGCPTTTQVGTPASAETVLCPASQVTIPSCGWLTTRVSTSAAARYPYSLRQLLQAGGIAIHNRAGRDAMDEVAATQSFVSKRTGKRRRARSDDFLHRNSAALKFTRQRQQPVVAAMRRWRQLRFRQAAILPVIVVQAAQLHARAGRCPGNGNNLLALALVDAGAIHPRIDVDKNSNAAAAPLPRLFFVLCQDGNAHVGKLLGNFLHAPRVGPHRGIREQHVGRPAAARHQQFQRGRALEVAHAPVRPASAECAPAFAVLMCTRQRSASPASNASVRSMFAAINSG